MQRFGTGERPKRRPPRRTGLAVAKIAGEDTIPVRQPRRPNLNPSHVHSAIVTIETRQLLHRGRLIAMLVPVTAIVMGGRISAQTPDSTQFRCDGRIITAIDVNPQPPAIIGRDPSEFRRAVQRYLFQSGTTRERAIRPFILARIGQRCLDSRLPELARVVRAQPYLASATVRAVGDGANGVRLVVETVDEVPIILGGGIGSGGISSFKYGNSNIAGTGLSASGQWRQGRAYRDGFSLSMRQFGLFEQPLVAVIEAQRAPLGGTLSAGVTRPFLSDLQHIAWYAGASHDKTYRHFVRETGPALSLPITRDIWSVGAVARYTWRGAGAMIGPVATYERSRPGAQGVIASVGGLLPADTAILENRYAPYRTFRAGVAGGMRWLNYMQVQGFDALLAEQDVGRGFQIAGTVERGLGNFSATDQSSLLSLDLYTGAGTPRSFVALALRGEGLPEGRGESWSGGVVSGRMAWYLRPANRRTLEASLEFAGGWRERLPLQLSLGEARQGPRGYKGAPLAGGRRAVLRLEQRRTAFGAGRYVQWGTAVFGDVGNTWSGGVPFGETVTRASVGFGLLAAVPPRSRRMLRADVAVPVTGGAPKPWTVRVFAVDATRFFWRDPDDVSPARARAPASAIFGWP